MLYNLSSLYKIYSCCRGYQFVLKYMHEVVWSMILCSFLMPAISPFALDSLTVLKSAFWSPFTCALVSLVFWPPHSFALESLGALDLAFLPAPRIPWRHSIWPFCHHPSLLWNFWRHLTLSFSLYPALLCNPWRNLALSFSQLQSLPWVRLRRCLPWSFSNYQPLPWSFTNYQPLPWIFRQHPCFRDGVVPLIRVSLMSLESIPLHQPSW